jgi:RNA polymerase sigma-70 factor (ECF subfamily)
MSPSAAAWESLALSVRDQRRIVARLASALGLRHLALAEDAMQTAVLRALRHWPEHGVPQNPAGWLYLVARRAALDALKGDRTLIPLPEPEEEAFAHAELPPDIAPEGRFEIELGDDELALLFAACHPSLPQATQVALALRTMARLDLGDVAAALLSTEAAVAQRLARARHLLAARELTVPAGDELPPRLDSVLTVLSLMFLAGQRADTAPDAGERAERARQACWEAIRLARAVAAHKATAHADADALAALLLLHGARLTGRLDDEGEIVPLPGQPRDRWDAGMQRLGLLHLNAARRSSRLSRWHLLAGIAAEHAVAPSYETTNWAAIAHYYALLVQTDPSAAPSLAHAIALVESGQANQGLQRLAALLGSVPAALRAHTLAAMSRAEQQLGHLELARHHLRQAIEAAPRPADARMLSRRLAGLDSLVGPAG